ncbi:hypothetical protein TNIN_429701 [Trichonephila inaurata madagascariensis]|uniref:Uncharacterized protein n=1 Tax=Trichonephila inaurata madagascariensis TaxID=2747483 RepID=A0A8X6YW33_9ARAC|nr:hypothetical protein TNIN_285991 [Trichonephila inaurata madagascariensis]GFY79448.1 hypothetical protein TNIN_429701 [Trichonephila inaurata madagascariensis]
MAAVQMRPGGGSFQLKRQVVLWELLHQSEVFQQSRPPTDSEFIRARYYFPRKNTQHNPFSSNSTKLCHYRKTAIAAQNDLDDDHVVFYRGLRSSSTVVKSRVLSFPDETGQIEARLDREKSITTLLRVNGSYGEWNSKKNICLLLGLHFFSYYKKLVLSGELRGEDVYPCRIELGFEKKSSLVT